MRKRGHSSSSLGAFSGLGCVAQFFTGLSLKAASVLDTVIEAQASGQWMRGLLLFYKVTGTSHSLVQLLVRQTVGTELYLERLTLNKANT